MYKLGLLGVGKMGSSILNGILLKGLYPKEDIAFYAPSIETQEKYQKLGIKLLKDERELMNSSNIIIMAIKPQVYDEVLEKVKDLDFSNKIVISLAPGKSINYLSKFYNNALIVRAMPNTPAIINQAVTTLCFSDKEVQEEIINIFKAIGTYVVVEEKQIDEAIPMNGSMPAYIFEFIKEFINKGMSYGFTYDESFQLVVNTIISSCNLAKESSDDIDTLINNVCSKGGSTIEGLKKLRNNGFGDAIDKCFDACIKRSKELGNV